jgi:hypothetical protein
MGVVSIGAFVPSGAGMVCAAKLKHGTMKPIESHGAYRTTEYRIWQGIKNRCSNPNDPRHKWYGARGIFMCVEWRDSFVAFRNYVGHRPSLQHSLDRIDNDRGYEPGNVRWALGAQQQRNSRSSRCYELDGQSKTLTEWIEEMGEAGISYDTVRQRVEKFKWSLRDALTRPLRKFRRRRSSKLYELSGEHRSLSEWARLAGVPYELVKHRILVNKWSLDEALGTPKGFGRTPSSERRRWKPDPRKTQGRAGER